MNVINSVVLTASSISSMVPLIGLVIFVGGILVLLVKWVSSIESWYQLEGQRSPTHFYEFNRGQNEFEWVCEGEKLIGDGKVLKVAKKKRKNK